MKTLLLALPLVFAQLASADGLFFGAKSESFKKNEFCYYRITVPQVVPAPGSSAQAQTVADALNAKWDAQLASAKADFQTQTLAPETCKDYESSYQTYSEFEIASALDAKIGAIVSTDGGYYGGAHGDYALSGLTFNMATGQIYQDLGDFLVEGELTALKQKIQEAIKYADEDFDPGFGFNDWNKKTVSLADINNFYFSPRGLVVIFNPYEVASYAEGAIKAEVSWYDLKEIGALQATGPATLLDTSSGE